MSTSAIQTPDLQPTLCGKLVSLRPLQESDFDPLYAVACDPLLWEMHPERNRFQRDVFQRFFAGAVESRGALTAIDAQTGSVIGTSRFARHDPALRTIEVGYTFVARSLWERGHNREMKALMLHHAFGFVDRVLFYIGEQNIRSRRAVEKIGARLVDRVERPQSQSASLVSLVYAIDRPAYLAGPLSAIRSE